MCALLHVSVVEWSRLLLLLLHVVTCISRFITPHAANKNYKAFVKALLRVTTDPLSSDDAKEIENTAGTIRADKVKAEKAAAAAKKGCECPVLLVWVRLFYLLVCEDVHCGWLCLRLPVYKDAVFFCYGCD
jgi:hypothetical protein